MVWDSAPVPDEAAYARNWWQILLTDLAIGVSMLGIGVAAALWWSPLAWLLVALGVFYSALVIRRFFKWRALRAASRGNRP